MVPGSMPVGGEVGDGMLGEGYEGEAALPPVPFMAARCVDDRTARSAALAGSRVCSAMDRSWLVCRCVGEVAFGVVPSMICFVEYWRFSPALDWPTVDGVGAGGDSVLSYAGAALRFGSGC